MWFLFRWCCSEGEKGVALLLSFLSLFSLKKRWIIGEVFAAVISRLRLRQLGIHNIIYSFLKNLLAWDSNHGLLTGRCLTHMANPAPSFFPSDMTSLDRRVSFTPGWLLLGRELVLCWILVGSTVPLGRNGAGLGLAFWLCRWKSLRDYFMVSCKKSASVAQLVGQIQLPHLAVVKCYQAFYLIALSAYKVQWAWGKRCCSLWMPKGASFFFFKWSPVQPVWNRLIRIQNLGKWWRGKKINILRFLIPSTPCPRGEFRRPLLIVFLKLKEKWNLERQHLGQARSKNYGRFIGTDSPLPLPMPSGWPGGTSRWLRAWARWSS